jgi:general secretion pathway protein G
MRPIAFRTMLTEERSPSRRQTPWPVRSAPGGFTLIEMIMVVALLGVLVAVAAPMYENYRERTRVAAAVRDIAAMAAEIQRVRLERRELPATLGEIRLGASLDPWGRPYVYYNVEANGRGGARKDRRLNPLNTDFDLYSLGRDGSSKPQISQKESVDDVIRANNGRFVGQAADY